MCPARVFPGGRRDPDPRRKAARLGPWIDRPRCGPPVREVPGRTPAPSGRSRKPCPAFRDSNRRPRHKAKAACPVGKPPMDAPSWNSPPGRHTTGDDRSRREPSRRSGGRPCRPAGRRGYWWRGSPRRSRGCRWRRHPACSGFAEQPPSGMPARQDSGMRCIRPICSIACCTCSVVSIITALKMPFRKPGWWRACWKNTTASVTAQNGLPRLAFFQLFQQGGHGNARALDDGLPAANSRVNLNPRAHARDHIPLR